MGEITCPRCAQVAPESDERCSACGAPLWSEVGPSAPKERGRRWILWLVILPSCGCFAFFALAIGSTLLLPWLAEKTERAREAAREGAAPAELAPRARLSEADEVALASRPRLLRVCKALEEYARWNDARMPSSLSELTTPDENGDVLLADPEDLLDEDGRPFRYLDPSGAGREATVRQVDAEGQTIASATLRLPE